MGIWRSIFGWEALFRWDVLAAIVPGLFFACGLAMLGVDWFPHNLLISQICLALTALLAAVKVIGHAVESEDELTSRITFGVVLSSLAVGGAVLAIIAIQEHKRSKETPISSTSRPQLAPSAPAPLIIAPSAKSQPESTPKVVLVPVPSAPPQLFPVVVKINVFKTNAHIENEGKRQITDVGLKWGLFSLNRDAYTRKQILVEGVTFPAFALKTIQINPGGHADIQIGVGPPSQMGPFTGTFQDILGKPDASPYPEVVVRITFRDSQTNQRYACYKVVSSIVGMPEPWGDYTATGGGYGSGLWLEDLPAKLVSIMKERYEDGAVDYHCER